MENAEKKLWRTLVRIVAFDDDMSYIKVVLPGWDPNKIVKISYDKISIDLRDKLQVGARFYMMVNIGAERGDDLIFISLR